MGVPLRSGLRGMSLNGRGVRGLDGGCLRSNDDRSLSLLAASCESNVNPSPTKFDFISTSTSEVTCVAFRTSY